MTVAIQRRVLGVYAVGRDEKMSAADYQAIEANPAIQTECDRCVANRKNPQSLQCLQPQRSMRTVGDYQGHVYRVIGEKG